MTFQVQWFENAWGSRLQRTRGHLGCRPPKDKAAYGVKETV